MNSKQYICMRLYAICLSNKMEKFSHPLLPIPSRFSLGKEMAFVWGSNLGRRKLKVEATSSHKRPHFGHVTNLGTVAVGGLLGLRGRGVDCVFRLMGRKRKRTCMDTGSWKRAKPGSCGMETFRSCEKSSNTPDVEWGPCADTWATFLYMNKDVRKKGNG